MSEKDFPSRVETMVQAERPNDSECPEEGLLSQTVPCTSEETLSPPTTLSETAGNNLNNPVTIKNCLLVWVMACRLWTCRC